MSKDYSKSSHLRPQREDQVIEWLSGQSIIDLAALVKDLEGKWGVSAAAAVAAPSPKEVQEAQLRTARESLVVLFAKKAVLPAGERSQQITPELLDRFILGEAEKYLARILANLDEVSQTYTRISRKLDQITP